MCKLVSIRLANDGGLIHQQRHDSRHYLQHIDLKGYYCLMPILSLLTQDPRQAVLVVHVITFPILSIFALAEIQKDKEEKNPNINNARHQHMLCSNFLVVEKPPAYPPHDCQYQFA